ncbi:hypothetical protein [Streptococcus catagoni]|uniref:hypothetical protein n=1 Tax=Streptococcus catagoni TaxID=2654874 RepID=UPI001A9F85CF|nr:hypothetical protein [Streptococcus catagoni]
MIIALSDFYQIILDLLIKEDQKMIQHLEASTNTVNSQTKLLRAIFINLLILLLFMIFNQAINHNPYIFLICAICEILSTNYLFIQIINKI